MKLRPSTPDRKAIDRLKEMTQQNTAAKAIMLAVHDYPKCCDDLRKANEKISQLQLDINQWIFTWERIRSGTFALDQLTGIDHPHKNTRNTKKKVA